MFEIKIIQPPVKEIGSVEQIKIVVKQKYYVKQGEIRTSNEECEWVTTGLGPCVAVGMVNSETGISAFAHLDDPNQNEVAKTREKVNKDMKHMIESVKGKNGEGKIYVDISQGSSESELFKQIENWWEKPPEDICGKSPWTWSVTLNDKDSSKPASADSAMYDIKKYYTMYAFDCKKTPKEEEGVITIQGIINGRG